MYDNRFLNWLGNTIEAVMDAAGLLCCSVIVLSMVVAMAAGAFILAVEAYRSIVGG